MKTSIFIITNRFRTKQEYVMFFLPEFPLTFDLWIFVGARHQRSIWDFVIDSQIRSPGAHFSRGAQMLFWRFVISGASTLDPASEGLDNILLAPNPHADERHLHFYFQFIQRQMEK